MASRSRSTQPPRNQIDPVETLNCRVKESVQEAQNTTRLRRRRPTGVCGRALDLHHAKQAEARAVALAAPPPTLLGSPSTELVPGIDPAEVPTGSRGDYIRTLEEPNAIAVAASEQRVRLATEADVLASAMDLAVTAQAANSIEKMLCHQLAAVHRAGMRLMGRIEDPLWKAQPTEAARLVTAAGRAFEVFQGAVLTLQKLKTRGRQHVLVQYQQVNVADGGQAVVAGKLHRGSRGRSKRTNGR